VSLGLDKCRLCLAVCPHGAAGSRSWGGREYPQLDRAICRQCPDFACRKSCPAGALAVYGEYLAAGEVIGRIQREGVLFQRSGGGLTVSGGEPLHQPEFLLRLLAEAKKKRLRTALETSGCGGYEVLAEAAGYGHYII
jgi:pyruvate formate lyase activating enzyme